MPHHISIPPPHWSSRQQAPKLQASCIFKPQQLSSPNTHNLISTVFAPRAPHGHPRAGHRQSRLLCISLPRRPGLHKSPLRRFFPPASHLDARALLPPQCPGLHSSPPDQLSFRELPNPPLIFKKGGLVVPILERNAAVTMLNRAVKTPYRLAKTTSSAM